MKKLLIFANDENVAKSYRDKIEVFFSNKAATKGLLCKVGVLIILAKF